VTTTNILAIAFCGLLILILFGMIKSSINDRKQRRLRAESMPVVPHSIRPGSVYDIHLSDGRTFKSVTVLGMADPSESEYATFPLNTWLVLQSAAGKRIFLRPTAIRFVEES
jgi:hypothetical protein